MRKSKKKQDLFKKVLTKALLMYIREQIPLNPGSPGGGDTAVPAPLMPVR